MEQYSLLSLHYMMFNNDVCHHVIQQLAVIGCNATISPQLVEIQTPLIWFVVDLLWICCRCFNLLWIRCTACCTANPKQIV